MTRLIELDDDELETITEMLREYRAAVARGKVVLGDGLQVEIDEELYESAMLVDKLERVLFSS